MATSFDHTSLCYLKPGVKLEPLICSWYAWPQLLAPVSAAMNITYRYLKILTSYVDRPMVHASAVKNPAFIGGPFIDLGGKHVDDVQELIEWTRRECAGLIALAEAITRFDQVLQSEATGWRLEDAYGRVPEELRGYVELVYDINDHPSLRFIEPLLYQSPYYRESYQSIALSPISADDRPFILSTPRIRANAANQIQLPIPFADERIDVLMRTRQEGIQYGRAVEMMGVAPADEPVFRTLFTDIRPERPEDRNFSDAGARVRYLGHACLLLQTREVSILVDPFISYDYPSRIPKYSFSDLPDRIDYVLLTHSHQDHTSIEDLIQLRHKVGQVVFPRNPGGSSFDPSLKLILQQLGFRVLVGMDEMDVLRAGNVEITALPFLGEHADLDIRSKTAYLIDIANKKLLLAADSTNLENRIYEHLVAHTGPVDMMFIGMECEGAPLSWLYGPQRTKLLSEDNDKSRRVHGSNCEQAWAIARTLQCRELYVYAMGMEPWLNHVMALAYTHESPPIVESDALVARAREQGMPAERLMGRKEWRWE